MAVRTFGRKLHADRWLELLRKLGAARLDDLLVAALSVAVLRLQCHLHGVARELALEGALEAWDNLSMAVQILERLLALTRVDDGAGVVLECVVYPNYRVLGDLHSPLL